VVVLTAYRQSGLVSLAKLTNFTGGNLVKAIIVGGGIAGPVTALALRSVGIDSVIYEAYQQGADAAGAFLSIASNGVEALKVIGAEEPVLNVAFPVRRMTFRNHRGKLLGNIDADESGSLITYTIKRSDLYRTLRDQASAAGVTIRYGKRFAGIVDGDAAKGGIAAYFEDRSVEHADVLIGCDGLHSAVRKTIDPNAPRPRYVPILNTGGYSRGVDVPGESATYHMYFGKRSFFAYVRAPDGTIYWFANPPEPDERNLQRLDRVGTDGWKKRLLELFRDDCSPAIEIIEAADEVRPPWATYDMPTLPRWSGGRMVLVGDSAHAASPSSGQGASMAIEDGLELAKCLRDLSPDRAFVRYEALRRGRVERVVAHGARSTASKAPGAFGRLIRDLVMPVILGRLTRPSALRWMYDYRIDFQGCERDRLDAAG
jgi:FAD-dependent urate hydroxylase